MEVLRSCFLLILLVATCHSFAILKNLTVNAPTLEEIRDDFIDGVSVAADDLQQSLLHKARATGGAVSTLGGLNINLLRNFLANNYLFWSNLGNGVSTKSSQLWNYISQGFGSNKPASTGSGMPSFMPDPIMPNPVMPGLEMPGSVMPGSGISSTGMPGSGKLSSWLSGFGKPLIIFPGSNMMGSGSGSSLPSPGAGSSSIFPGSGTGSGPISSGTGSFFPGSGTGANSLTSKFERLRTKFVARPGCSLWESIKLPESRQAEDNFLRSEPEAIVKALEADEFRQNDEVGDNDVTSS